MNKTFIYLKKSYFFLYLRYCHFVTKLSFKLNGVKFNSFSAIGIPILDVDLKGSCELGTDVGIVSAARYATLGKSNRCKFVVWSGGKLIIGNKVGMSNTAIIATLSITIGNNVLIGGGVTIVDTDFHSLNSDHWHTMADYDHMIKMPVVIKDDVFIGMDSIILKGVTIGSGVVIAAGSVVSKDIPDNEVWGGNPAKFIKSKTS
ncbi:acyltransferase [Mucilaginibacter sp. HD30]